VKYSWAGRKTVNNQSINPAGLTCMRSITVCYVYYFSTTCINNRTHFMLTVRQTVLHTLMLITPPTPMVKASVSYHEASHFQPASVRFMLLPMWQCEKVCQFTCGRSVVSPHIHWLMYLGFSLPPFKSGPHHITEKLLNIAKNYKQITLCTNYQDIGLTGTCISKNLYISLA
jgi:hypothetical protein